MMADDMVVAKAWLAAFAERTQGAIVDRRGLAMPFAGNLEPMGKEAERSSAGIFAAGAAVRMQRGGEEGDCAGERLAQTEVAPKAIDLGEQANGERQIAGVGAAIFLEPAFAALPG